MGAEVETGSQAILLALTCSSKSATDRARFLRPAIAGGRELAALTSHVEEQVKSLLGLTTE